MLIVVIVIYYLELRKDGSLNNNQTSNNGTVQQKSNVTESYMYNGFPFIKIDGTWVTKIKDKYNTSRQFYSAMHFGPKELENISAHGALKKVNNPHEEVIVAFDPQDPRLGYVNLAATEFTFNAIRLHRGFQYENLNITPGCIANTDPACAEWPIAECTKNSTKLTVYFKQSNTTDINFDGNCITVKGKDMELIKGADFVLYELLGVLE